MDAIQGLDGAKPDGLANDERGGGTRLCREHAVLSHGPVKLYQVQTSSRAAEPARRLLRVREFR